ncbi:MULTISPECIES: peptide-methionine (R)-S-oxide reductase MsrB [unclassified Sphingomonas]|uniref:peptide-methionine (R)-S-oxide reductase MsrB n=1 Tax=unclassified Sphingomonas TaxID=196159 RepID=UPI00215104CE|nr:MULTISPECIES: peptide-methionine (R)-S-oxide reductase MsrB [unclassified Sphingomonas]MCR5871335.1 peptide-methionine (R)-S-oxide reductase MsrB [Sphingomonas sp. J344]UUY00360.1 peptide-methionine (R)-S-oxide reductase MsrB [Sphingomonas sp. J315]
MRFGRRHLLGAAAGGGLAVVLGCRSEEGEAADKGFAFSLTDAEWRKRLTPAQYRILRQEGTERPGSSPLNREKRAGIYACAGCGLPLYASRTKFESGTGWPSFWAPLDNAVRTKRDLSLGMVRTEVICRRCGGHLGHVFDDGPRPTGKRHCINGLALKFRPA